MNKIRLCLSCNCDISDYYRNAKRCKKCSYKREKVLKKMYGERNNERIKKYAKQYRDDHKEEIQKYRDQHKEQRYRYDKYRQQIINNLKINGCAICGYDKCNASLDFHHVNSKDKKFLIIAHNVFKKDFVDEINKCILLCRNCHMEIHNNEVKI